MTAASAPTLERAGLDAAPAIAALVNQAYRGHDGVAAGWTSSGHLLGGQRIDADAVAALLTRTGSHFLLWHESATLLGCVLVSELREGVGEIGLLAVRPDHQAGGRGRLLLAAAEQALVDCWQAQRSELTVLSPRPELEAWYLRRGYRPSGGRHSLDSPGSGYGEPLQAGLELVEYFKPLR